MGPRRRREKGPEKIFEEIIAENIPNRWNEIVNQVQEANDSRQDKLKENTLRHVVIKLTKIKNKDKNLKAEGKNRQHTTEIPQDYQLISQQNLYKPEGNGTIYFKW